MTILRLVFLLAVALGTSGCGTLPSHLRKAIPEGEWATINATITGKFSSTRVDGKNVKKDGAKLTAEDLHIRHSNVWVPLIEVDAKGFVPEAKK